MSCAGMRISLKAARVNAGISQKMAAKHLNVSVSTLQNYECGKTIPNWGIVRLMEDMYHISADNLFFERNSA